MGGNEENLKRIMVRLSYEDYDALEEEAKKKGSPLASYVRDLIKAHLLNKEFDDKIEQKLEALIMSDRFDDIFFEKLSKFFEARRRQ